MASSMRWVLAVIQPSALESAESRCHTPPNSHNQRDIPWHVFAILTQYILAARFATVSPLHEITTNDVDASTESLIASDITSRTRTKSQF